MPKAKRVHSTPKLNAPITPRVDASYQHCRVERFRPILGGAAA